MYIIVFTATLSFYQGIAMIETNFTITAQLKGLPIRELTYIS